MAALLQDLDSIIEREPLPALAAHPDN